MSYRVVVPRPAVKHLDVLPAQMRARVLRQVRSLADETRPHGCIKLKGYADEYRIRVGDYRVRYRIDDSASSVVIIDVRHRKDIYRN